MKITDERKTKTVPFGALSSGDVFEYKSVKYMKTQETDKINAVSVYQGIFEYFDCNTYVQSFDAELIIKE